LKREHDVTTGTLPLSTSTARVMEQNEIPDNTNNNPPSSYENDEVMLVKSIDESTLQPIRQTTAKEKSPRQRFTSISNDLISDTVRSKEKKEIAITSDQPPCAVGEKIMVDTPNGFKFAKIKFIGPTEFAQGEWIGVALERPAGEFIMGNVIILLLIPY